MTIIKLENSFADGTTRKMELGNFEDGVKTPVIVKAAINNINEHTADIANLYLSEGGASFTGITYAEIVQKNITEYNL